jgi:hypothetical protein
VIITAARVICSQSLPADATETPTSLGRTEICHAWAGGRLDFERDLPDPSLYNAGEMYAHKDGVGNAV